MAKIVPRREIREKYQSSYLSLPEGSTLRQKRPSIVLAWIFTFVSCPAPHSLEPSVFLSVLSLSFHFLLSFSDAGCAFL